MMIAADKIAHFKAGSLAAAFGVTIGSIMGAISPHGSLIICAAVGAVVAAASAGITKELADRADNLINPGMHGVEIMDAVATSLGAVPVLALLWLASLGADKWLH